MAKCNFLLQAATNETHSKAITKLLQITTPSHVVISVAFAREAGINELANALLPIIDKTTFYIGVRNDITSIQAVNKLISMNAKVFAVDTGSRHVIFHPKIYFSKNNDIAHAIVGSANMTFQGLNNNIESSVDMKLDLNVTEDLNFVDDLLNKFNNLKKNHPKHVFRIRTNTDATKLLREGRLSDEKIKPKPSSAVISKSIKRDDLSSMTLVRKTQPRKTLPTPKKKAAPKKTTTISQKSASHGYKEVYESKALTERDLNIPKSSGTNPTGSMGWKKGMMINIDQRHYFRDEVFNNLAWTRDIGARKHWERSEAKFELIIKNVSYGDFILKLSHLTDKNSATYKQNNMTTQLHWGDAKEHIAQKDLLGRQLILLQNNNNPKEFVIEID
ncbi:MAG: phospholipase D family protein [Methylococcales bacterium]